MRKFFSFAALISLFINLFFTPISVLAQEITPDITPTALPEAIIQTPEPTVLPTTTPEPTTDPSISTGVVVNDVFPSTVTDNSWFKLFTDKLDYAPTEIAVISGNGLSANKAYSLTISSTDDPATSTTIDVTTDANGSFTYSYQLDGIYRPNYSVVIKDGEVVVGTTSFTDSRAINSATLNGGNSVTVAPSASITSVVSVTTDGSGSNSRWRSTGWRVSTSAGTMACINHTDHDNAGTHTETFTITAPASTGTYNAYFIAYSNDGCSSGASSTLTKTNGVTVQNSDTTPPVISKVITGTIGSNGWYKGNVTVTGGELTLN